MGCCISRPPRVHGEKTVVIVARQQLQIFESATSWDAIGVAPAGVRLTATWPPENVDGFDTYSLVPHGAVAFNGGGGEATLGEPDLSEVEADGATKYASLLSIQEALHDSSTVLLRGQWLRALAGRGGVLPSRQDLPPAAIWEPSGLMRGLRQRRVKLVAISYCWATPDHPDPHGAQLRTLGHVLGLLLDEPLFELDDLAVFFDWGSLYQRERTEEQQESFDRGLRNVNLWYTHQESMVLLLTKVPPGPGVKEYDERGWPTFERAISGLLTDSDQLLDVGLLDASCRSWHDAVRACRGGRRAPQASDAFAAELATTTFTNNADHGFVEKKYAETLQEVLGQATQLKYVDCLWGPAEFEALAGAISICGALQQLDLSHNSPGLEGIRALAASLPRCGSLARLAMQWCEIDGEAAAELARAAARLPAWGPGAGAPAEFRVGLDLTGNPIGDEGAEALVASLEGRPNCQVLGLSHARLTDAGLRALALRLPRTGVERLRLDSPSGDYANAFSERGKREMAEAWAAAGRDPERLHF